MISAKVKLNRRKVRIRNQISKNSKGRLRLTVFRSNMHIYAQVIDDSKRMTLASASTLDKAFKDFSIKTSNIGAAEVVGKLIAERLLKLGIEEVVFDRSGYLYHGRVKALANAARSNGLSF